MHTSTQSQDAAHICIVCGEKQLFSCIGGDPDDDPMWDCSNYCAQIRAMNAELADLEETHDINAECICQSDDPHNVFGCIECNYTGHPLK